MCEYTLSGLCKMFTSALSVGVGVRSGLDIGGGAAQLQPWHRDVHTPLLVCLFTRVHLSI